MGTAETISLEILTLFAGPKVVSIFAAHIACCLAKYMSTQGGCCLIRARTMHTFGYCLLPRSKTPDFFPQNLFFMVVVDGGQLFSCWLTIGGPLFEKFLFQIFLFLY